MKTMNTETINIEASVMAIKKHILSSIPLMEKNKLYKLKQIFLLTVEGRDYWNNEINPTDTGYCVAQMVKKGLLPLIAVGKASDNALLYKTI